MGKSIEDCNHSRKFFILLMVCLVGFSIFLIKSMIVSIIGGCLLAYIFHPVYKKLSSWIKNRHVAAILMSLLLVLLVLVPIIFSANAIITESISFVHNARAIDLSDLESKVAAFTGKSINLDYYLRESAAKFSAIVAEWAQKFVLSLASKALSAFVMLFVMYYLFKDGEALVRKLEADTPLKSSIKQTLLKRFHEVTYATVYGLVLTAIVQGAFGALGFWLFKVPSPILWGLVMVVLAMIPLVGTALIWLPAALYKIILHDYFNGFGLLIFGILVIGSVDNLIRPKIIGSTGNIHPAIALLGVLGGLEVFGLFGLIIGPLILAITYVLVEIYISERKKANL